MMTGPIYLDHAATTPVAPAVAQAMVAVMQTAWGNPSSVHRVGREARQRVDTARRQVAQAIGAPRAQDIIFTSGGSEADNLALQGVMRQRAREGRRHLIVSAIEHHAVLDAARQLEREGFALTVLPVDAWGQVTVATLKGALRPDTGLVSIMLANNEIGTIQPVAALAALTHEAGAYFHTDAVQAVGQMPVHVGSLGVDLLSLTAHKLYGPKGIGALYVRRGLTLEPLLYGGAQERLWRPGTENVPGIVGFGLAAQLAVEHLSERVAHMRRMRDRLAQALFDQIPGIVLNGAPLAPSNGQPERLPNNLNVSIPGTDSESLLMRLDLAGICASSGSACTSGSLEPSHVLRALPVPAEVAVSALRFSVGCDTTAEQVDATARTLAEIARDLRGLAS